LTRFQHAEFANQIQGPQRELIIDENVGHDFLLWGFNMWALETGKAFADIENIWRAMSESSLDMFAEMRQFAMLKDLESGHHLGSTVKSRWHGNPISRSFVIEVRC
jgi:hypothetical protein